MICADDAVGTAIAGEPAAVIAAAAIAGEAVALPDAGVAGGTSAAATVAGIATATAFGVTDAVPCGAEPAGSAADLLSEDDFAVGFAVPAFESPDFGLDGWTPFGSALVVVLASEASLAGWLAAAASEDWGLSEVAGGSSARRCGAGCVCAGEPALALLVLAAVLLSTSAPKLSAPDDNWSDRADLWGAPGKDTFVGAFDVTLYTGGLSQ